MVTMEETMELEYFTFGFGNYWLYTGRALKLHGTQINYAGVVFNGFSISGFHPEGEGSTPSTRSKFFAPL